MILHFLHKHLNQVCHLAGLFAVVVLIGLAMVGLVVILGG
jgi:hypothetical protein